MAEQKKSSSSGTSKKSTTTKSTGTPTKKTASRKKSSTARAPRAEPGRKPSASRVAAEAARQFAELSAKAVEGVTGLRRTDEGWVVELDVLELRRVPETTDVLASYEVSMDDSGELLGYRRVHRYVRGQVEEGS